MVAPRFSVLDFLQPARVSCTGWGSNPCQEDTSPHYTTAATVLLGARSPALLTPMTRHSQSLPRSWLLRVTSAPAPFSTYGVRCACTPPMVLPCRGVVKGKSGGEWRVGASHLPAEAAPSDFMSVERWFCSRIGENNPRPRRFYTGGAMVEDVDVSRRFPIWPLFP